jgi:hypothetical protein
MPSTEALCGEFFMHFQLDKNDFNTALSAQNMPSLYGRSPDSSNVPSGEVNQPANQEPSVANNATILSPSPLPEEDQISMHNTDDEWVNIDAGINKESQAIFLHAVENHEIWLLPQYSEKGGIPGSLWQQGLFFAGENFPSVRYDNSLYAFVIEQLAGFEVSKKDRAEALVAAVENKHYYTIYSLARAELKDVVEEGKMHQEVPGGEEALAIAAKKRYLTVFKEFLDYFPYVLRGPAGAGALKIAAKKDHHEIVEILTKHFFEDVDTEGALLIAAENGSSSVVKFLVGKKLDVTGKVGEKALMVAAENGHYSVIQNLADGGLDVTGEAGDEALQVAQKHNQTAFVEFLTAERDEQKKAKIEKQDAEHYSKTPGSFPV